VGGGRNVGGVAGSRDQQISEVGGNETDLKQGLYFDNSSAFPRSITNQVRGRKSDESSTSAISAAEKQKLSVSYIFVSTTQISARSSGMSWKAWGGRGGRSAPLSFLGGHPIDDRWVRGNTAENAGLHPATGGDGSLACSPDTLLEALVRDGRGSKRTSYPAEGAEP
jgi:hypothetical protein